MSKRKGRGWTQYLSERRAKENAFSNYYKQMGSKRYWKYLSIFLSEIFATYLFAVASILAAQQGYPIETIAKVEALSIFFILFVFAQEYAGHFSPLTTIGLYVGGKIAAPWYTIFIHLIATTIGWILGTATNIGFAVNADRTSGLGTPEIVAPYTEAQGFLAECVGTCISFGVPILALYGMERHSLYSDVTPSSDSKLNLFLYPAVVSAAHYVAFTIVGAYSGAALNPHRFFWPAIIGDRFDAPRQWPYLIGPVVAALIVGLIYILFLVFDDYGRVSAKNKNILRANLKNAVNHKGSDYVKMVEESKIND